MKSSDVFAISLSGQGQHLAGTTESGHVKVWDLNANDVEILDYETNGDFGLCLDWVSYLFLYYSILMLIGTMPQSADGRFLASGHVKGSIFIFNVETGQMPFSLSSMRGSCLDNMSDFALIFLFSIGLVKPVRAVSFSPGGKLLAAAGDSKIIVLYDTASGEAVANLSGHSAWIMSISWSHSGEYLLSWYVSAVPTSGRRTLS